MNNSRMDWRKLLLLSILDRKSLVFLDFSVHREKDKNGNCGLTKKQQRGWFVRSAGYSSIPREDYFSSANNTLVILQLEGKKALDNLDAILDVDGFDIIFIGPYDLSQSPGYPGQINHPEVLKEMKLIVNNQGKEM